MEQELRVGFTLSSWARRVKKCNVWGYKSENIDMDERGRGYSSENQPVKKLGNQQRSSAKNTAKLDN